MTKERTYTVYALIDPRDNSIRYIGIAEHPAIRLEQHLQSSGGNIPKRQWINELRQLGLTPMMQPIETGLSLPVALEHETMWIQHYLSAGIALVNRRVTPFVSYTVKNDARGKSNVGSAAKPGKRATLDDLITEAGLRKSELANESGINAATITRISHAEATTRVTVVKLVRVLEKYLNRKIDIDSIEGLNITR
jgi:GIY-YIG catalytic domain